eukprot:scaffold35161_cov64-Phaeocystis_antarctica.AAC.18
MAPSKLPPPGPSSSTALAPSTKRSSPGTHRRRLSTCGSPSMVGASNSSCTEWYSGEHEGAATTPVAKMTIAKVSPLTTTCSPPGPRHTWLRSISSSTSSCRAVEDCERRLISSIYVAGTLPPDEASRTAPRRLLIGRLRNS